MARALRPSRTLEHVAAGPRSYRIVGLDAAGKPNGAGVEEPGRSMARSPRRRPPCPSIFAPFPGPKASSCSGLRGRNFPRPRFPTTWSSALAPRARRQREVPSPVLLNESRPGPAAACGQSAPVEQEVTYSLCGVDVFGRRTAALEARVFHSDHQALVPPDKVKTDSVKGRITLTWEPNPSPNTRLVYVERSYMSDGTYITLTPRGCRTRPAPTRTRPSPAGRSPTTACARWDRRAMPASRRFRCRPMPRMPPRRQCPGG